MRRSLVLVALAILVVPLAQAAASGARSPISADNPVSDVGMARDSSRFAGATTDPGSVLSGDRSAESWRMWNLDGSDRTSGGIDPDGCPNAPEPLENCQTRATRIAINAAGTRIAVAGQTGEGTQAGNAVIGLFTDGGAELFTVEQETATVNALDISAAGSRVVAGGLLTVQSAQDPSDGFLLSLDSSGTDAFDGATFESPVTSVAINSDGSRLVAGAGHHIRASPSSATLYENTRSDGTSSVQGSVRAVDVSDHAKGWSVAGYDSGYFALFSDAQGGPGTSTSSSVQDYQKREAGDTAALTGVAIRPNGTAFVTGSSAGRLRLYTMDPSVNAATTGFTPTMASTLDNAGAVVELQFSGDGRYLAARAGGGVRFYDTQGGVLTELWRDDRTGMANAIAVDGRGEHVVAAVGSSVIVYDAIHKLTPTFPSATQTPGTTVTHSLTLRNDGNRADKVDLFADPPAGVTVSLTPSAFILKPGQSQAVQAAVSLPSTQAPGSLGLPIRHTLNGGADGTGSSTLTLSVPTVRKVLFEPEGATSKGGTADNPALFDVTVRNAGNLQETVALKLTGPSGWGLTVEPTSLSLPPGASGNVTVTMDPPSGSRDGASATAVLSREGGVATPLELTATVGAYFQVRLVVPAGSVLEAGKSGLVDATVHNEGNALDSIHVKLNALPAGWRGGFLNGLAELQVEDVEAGGSRVVQVSLMPPEDAVSDVPLQVGLTAKSLGDPTKATSKGILVTVVDANATSDSDSETDEGGDNGIPGPGPLLLAGALAVAALVVRRKKA